MGLFDKYKKSNINESVDWEKSMDGNDNNLDRIKRLKNLQVDIPPVMGDALEDNEKFDKNAKEVFTKLAKDAKDITPKDPDTGKKVTIKPYTEKLNLDENLFKESWITFDGSWKDQTIKKVFYEEDDISDIAERLMNWYGECFEGWEAADIKDALYGLEGERIPGSSCPIIFTMEESDEDEYDWGSDDDDEEYDESLEKKSLSEDFSVEPGKVFTSKSGHKIVIKSVVPYITYKGDAYLRINYDFELKNGESGNDECSEYDLFNMLHEDLNLLEYVNEEDAEDDEYTVYDLLNDRLFGYGINKSNFRVKWKFAEIEPTVKTRDGKLKRGYFYPTIHQDELVTGKSDDRRAFTEDGIGVFVHDEDEASLVKKCAEELNLDFVMKKLVRPHNGFNYVATIKVSDDIQEMPIKDYMESIGKSMSDLLRGKEDKIKSNFKDSKNYQSRKTNKEQQETAEE